MGELENKIALLEEWIDAIAETLEFVLISEQRRLYEIRRVERRNGLDTCTEDIERIEKLKSSLRNGLRRTYWEEKNVSD